MRQRRGEFAQRGADAVDVLATLFNGRASADPATALAGMQANLGDVGTLAFNFAFGEVWSRTELSRRDRSLVVVAILAGLGVLGAQAFPTFMEYQAVLKAIDKAKDAGRKYISVASQVLAGHQ